MIAQGYSTVWFDFFPIWGLILVENRRYTPYGGGGFMDHTLGFKKTASGAQFWRRIKRRIKALSVTKKYCTRMFRYVRSARAVAPSRSPARLPLGTALARRAWRHVAATLAKGPGHEYSGSAPRACAPQNTPARSPRVHNPPPPHLVLGTKHATRGCLQWRPAMAVVP